MARTRPHPAAPQRAGFTLVEVAITLALMVVLGSLAVPSFSTQIARQRLQSAARNLQADVARARLEADKAGRPVALRFQPGRDWCYVLGPSSTAEAGAHTAPPPADCQSAALPPGQLKRVRAADTPDVALLDASPMLITDRSGNHPTQQLRSSLAGGQARFASLSQPGQELLVRLGPQGRASLCAPADPVPGTPPCTPR